MSRRNPNIPNYTKVGRPKGMKQLTPPDNQIILRNAENARIICDKIVQGIALKQIARDFGAAHASTIHMWIAQDAAFAEQYRLAKQAQADVFAEECIEIADDGSNDWLEREGKQQPNYELAMRSKLRVETRMKLMRFNAPKRFGNTVAHEHSGEVAVNVSHQFARAALAEAFEVIEAWPAQLEQAEAETRGDDGQADD